MARTIANWQQIIIDELSANNIIVSGSRTSLRRLWTYVFAFCAWSLDVLFDLHKAETLDLISQKTPHHERWYRNHALSFQYGYPLIFESDKYDNAGIDEQLIEASKIIKYCAVVSGIIDNRRVLIVKVATEVNGKLQPLTVGQKDAFEAYMETTKDAGVEIVIINYLPDRLFITQVIYYNPLILDASGNSIITGGKPVEEAMNQYMKELPFNGELVLAHYIDKLQKVSGVMIPDLKHAETSWIDATIDDYGALQTIDVKKIPESGYFEIVDFTNTTYLPNV